MYGLILYSFSIVHLNFNAYMKYIPSITFEEMSGSAKAKVFMKYS